MFCEFFGEECAGAVMRVALAVLCIGAVTFLLRVLAALVREARSGPSSTVIHYAKFKPARQRGEVIEMNLVAQNRDVTRRTG